MSRRRGWAPVLEVSELQVRYGKSHIVFDLGLKVGEGEVLALLGRNGAGKTTTIMGIVGLIPGTSGHVVIDGVEVGRWAAFRRAKAGIAYVPSGARCFAPRGGRGVIQDFLVFFRLFRGFLRGFFVETSAK